MTLRQWFNESPDHKYAVYDGKNGRRYIYYRYTKSKLLDKLCVDQELNENGIIYCWVY